MWQIRFVIVNSLGFQLFSGPGQNQPILGLQALLDVAYEHIYPICSKSDIMNV